MKRFLAVVLATAMVTACSNAFSPEGVAGVYNLETVEGQSLPVTVGGVNLTAMSITLNADGTFTESQTTDVGIVNSSGTYTLVEPSTILFAPSGGVGFSGSTDGDSLALLRGDRPSLFLFRR